VLSPWAASRGAKVCRLFVEDGNTAAERQVEALGFTVVAHWFHCALDDLTTKPVAAGNGGRRKPRRSPLTAAARADVPALFISWSDSDLYRAARGLISHGWTCRRMRDVDLEEAVGSKTLLEGSAGAVIVGTDDEYPHQAWLSWISTEESSAADLVKDLIDASAGREFGAVRGMLPETAWLRAAFEAAGFDTTREQLYSRPLR